MALENDVISLQVGKGAGKGKGVELNTWKSYTFNSHYLTPTDGWSFTLGDETLTDEVRNAIAARQEVSLSIGGHVQSTGIIDKITTNSSRGSGTEITIEGRDNLSLAVDSVIDPRVQFNQKMDLLSLIIEVFEPFGIDTFFVDGQDNVNVMTGKHQGRKTTKKGKPLKAYELHLLRPSDHETAFSFASRVCQRFGLWIHLSAAGDYLIVGTPDFDTDPIYKISHKTGEAGINNVILSSTATLDAGSQPSVLIASGFGSGGENPREHYTLGVVNPAVLVDNQAIFNAYPKTRFIESNFVVVPFEDPFARPLFLHDDNAKSEEELEFFLRRELALRMHKSFTYTFEVEGHQYVGTDGTLIPWAVDTIVTVNDDFCNVHENLWIISRTFTKSRSGGTKTKIECIRPHSLEF